MAASSKHYGDIAKWIEKVIDSCKTTDRLQGAFNLANNFRIMFPEQYHLLFSPLWFRANNKSAELIKEPNNQK